ncbi:MAG: hypothetical protein EXR77_19270 [Myxococcales bacterium]|nr:hypothetical protein [Myxococcales bacterium]
MNLGWLEMIGLEMIRRRRSVENHNPNTLETAFMEDLRPWLWRPQGMLVMNLLRRMVHNTLAIFRSVTTRAEPKRAIAWPELLQRTNAALIRTTQAMVEGLARRETVLG